MTKIPILRFTLKKSWHARYSIYIESYALLKKFKNSPHFPLLFFQLKKDPVRRRRNSVAYKRKTCTCTCTLETTQYLREYGTFKISTRQPVTWVFLWYKSSFFIVFTLIIENGVDFENVEYVDLHLIYTIPGRCTPLYIQPERNLYSPRIKRHESNCGPDPMINSMPPSWRTGAGGGERGHLRLP